MKLTDSPTDDDLIAPHMKDQREFAAAQVLEHRKEIEAFKDFSAKMGVPLTDDNFSYVPTIGIVAYAPGILYHLIQNIPQERDGVIRFDKLTKIYRSNIRQPGYFQADNFMLMAHPYFRREMHGVNNFAPSFIDLFWSFEDAAVIRYIAIDEDRVRVNVENSFYRELDTWYGPPFNDDISKIQNDIVKLRPPIDLKPIYVKFFFADTYCLDIKWTQKGSIKTFQALEFKTENSYLIHDNKCFFPARYLHAEFDLDLGFFRHFDGAIQCYTESEYLQRRDSDFNYNVKNSTQIKARSRKVFKLNGKLETKKWVEFSSHFLAGNPLVHEYFTGHYPEYVNKVIGKIRAHSAPHEDA